MRATLRSNLFNPSTGRAQRRGASTGAKRLALGSHQFNALCLCVKTVSILKAPKIFNQKTPENPGRTQNRMSRQFQILIECGLGMVNGLILLTLYVAQADCVSMGFVKPAISGWAEIACIIGLVAVLLLMLFFRRNTDQSANRVTLIMILTLWNQMCLIALLVSLIPMSSHGSILPPVS